MNASYHVLRTRWGWYRTPLTRPLSLHITVEKLHMRNWASHSATLAVAASRRYEWCNADAMLTNLPRKCCTLLAHLAMSMLVGAAGHPDVQEDGNSESRLLCEQQWDGAVET